MIDRGEFRSKWKESILGFIITKLSSRVSERHFVFHVYVWRVYEIPFPSCNRFSQNVPRDRVSLCLRSRSSDFLFRSLNNVALYNVDLLMSRTSTRMYDTLEPFS